MTRRDGMGRISGSSPGEKCRTGKGRDGIFERTKNRTPERDGMALSGVNFFLAGRDGS